MFSTRNAGCSLGFNPSKVCYRRPGSGFRPISSRTLLRTDSRPPAGVSEYRSALASASSGLTASRKGKDETTLIGFPHPTRPCHSSKTPIRAMCSPRAAPHIAVCHYALWMGFLLYRSCTDKLRCRASRPQRRNDGEVDAREALQSLRIRCSNLGVSTLARPPRVGCPFRVIARSGIAVMGLTIPLCR
jgi:hypothetical protein